MNDNKAPIFMSLNKFRKTIVDKTMFREFCAMIVQQNAVKNMKNVMSDGSANAKLLIKLIEQKNMHETNSRNKSNVTTMALFSQ